MLLFPIFKDDGDNLGVSHVVKGINILHKMSKSIWGTKILLRAVWELGIRDLNLKN